MSSYMSISNDVASPASNPTSELKLATKGIGSLIHNAHYNLPRLYASVFALRSAFGVVTLLLPIYLTDLQHIGGPKFSGIQIGLIVGSIFLSEIALVTLFGHLSDVVQRRKPFIVVGNIIAALAFAMFSVFQSFTLLFAAHLFEGVGAAMAMGPTLAMVGDSSKVENHGRNMGLFESVTFGGMAFGFFMGSMFYDTILGGINGGGRWTFAISSLFLVGGGLLATQLKEEGMESIDGQWELIKRFYREIIPHKIMFGFSIVTVAFISVLSSISLILSGQFNLFHALIGKGLDPQYTSIFYGASIITAILGLIDFYFETYMSEERKQPISGNEHAKSHFQELLEAFEERELRLILPAWYFVMIILGTIVTFLPIILSTGITQPGQGETLSADESFSSGLKTSEIGTFFLIGILILGLMQVFFGKMVDRYGRRPILLLGVLSIVALSAEVVFVVTFHPEWFADPFKGQSFIFIIIAGITALGVSGFGPAALSVLADSSNHENRGVTSGVYSLLLGGGHITGDLLGGILWDVGDALGGSNGSALAIFIFIFVMALGAYYFVSKIKSPNWKMSRRERIALRRAERRARKMKKESYLGTQNPDSSSTDD